MNRSYKHKFVWHAPFKVASRAVADVFRHTSDLNPHLPQPDNPRMIFTHENMWPEDCPRDYLHIVSVRHPYYRWVSYWKHGIYDNNEINQGINVIHTQSNNFINIKNELQEIAVKSASLLNILGQEVMVWKIYNQNQADIQLRIGDLSSGTYIVKVFIAMLI